MPPVPSSRSAVPLRIIVLGYVVRGPVGGMTWCSLNYLHGLRGLGHDVLFIEDSTDDPWCCYDPARGVVDADPGFGLRYAGEVFAREGFGENWAYWDAHQKRWFGSRALDAAASCRNADLLLNISGLAPLRPWTAEIPRRVFIDTDPAFTQIKHLQDSAAHERAQQHTAFFTFGENYGRPGCLIPDDGLSWRPTRQPVALDRWTFTPAPSAGAFTTVMLWNSYAPRIHEGARFGMKSESFRPYFDLPSRASVPLELALGGADAPRDDLRRAGWRIVDPLIVAGRPSDYFNYIAASAGEFGVAKHGFVATCSGAFSDRTAVFLASGRPAVVQDTGFSSFLPVGEGLLPFSSPDEALAALATIQRNPARHQRAARATSTHFDANVVLRSLIEEAMSGPT